MGSGKGAAPSINPALAAEAYQNFSGYGARANNANINSWPGYTDWAAQNPSLVSYAQAGWEAGLGQRRAQEQLNTIMGQMSEAFKAPEITPGQSPEEIQKQNDIAKRDQLFSEYMDAATAATDYINQQIQQERANATLMGIDYVITDEIKQQRINDYFASLWGEGEDKTLKQLIKQYGNPEGFTGEWLVTRGTASTDTTTKQTESSTSIAPKAKRKKAESILPESEQLGSTIILGK